MREPDTEDDNMEDDDEEAEADQMARRLEVAIREQDKEGDNECGR